jgi:hypothetical protein
MLVHFVWRKYIPTGLLRPEKYYLTMGQPKVPAPKGDETIVAEYPLSEDEIHLSLDALTAKYPAPKPKEEANGQDQVTKIKPQDNNP